MKKNTLYIYSICIHTYLMRIVKFDGNCEIWSKLGKAHNLILEACLKWVELSLKLRHR